MAAEKKLSKREQKAEAFKKRAKKPQFTDEMAVPQSDEIVEQPQETQQQEQATKEAPKAEKRKAEPISVPTEESQEPHKKKNRRSKKSSNMEGSRYIVFIGKKRSKKVDLNVKILTHDTPFR